jgi:hypothetical protein
VTKEAERDLRLVVEKMLDDAATPEEKDETDPAGVPVVKVHGNNNRITVCLGTPLVRQENAGRWTYARRRSTR